MIRTASTASVEPPQRRASEIVGYTVNPKVLARSALWSFAGFWST